MPGHVDRWLLPRRQTEYPARDLVAEARLHARREATFLALAAIAVASAAVLVAPAGAHVIDLSALLASLVPTLDLPVRLALPLGAIPCALGFLAVLLACELYGRRRARALVWAIALVMAALVGLAYVADLADGRDAALAPAAALAAGALVAHVAGLVVFDALRRALAGRHPGLRAIFASTVAQVLTAAVVIAVLDAFAGGARGAELEAIIALALGGAAYTLACVIALALPLAIVARAFALFLRVARFEDDASRLPPALVVDDEQDGEAAPRRRRAARATLGPFSAIEQRFFTEGDQLEDAV